MSLGRQVLAIARVRDEGVSIKEIVEEAAKVLKNLVQMVAIETLEFDPEALLINITGPVLGINTGPGVLALNGCTDE